MGVEGVKGRVESGVLEHEVFSVGAVSGGCVEVANDTAHGREYVVFGPASGVPLDGIEVEPFVKLVSVVAHASECTGGKRLVGTRFLEEGGIAHALGKGGVGCGPGEMKGRVFPEEGEARGRGIEEREGDSEMGKSAYLAFLRLELGPDMNERGAEFIVEVDRVFLGHVGGEDKGENPLLMPPSMG